MSNASAVKHFVARGVVDLAASVSDAPSSPAAWWSVRPRVSLFRPVSAGRGARFWEGAESWRCRPLPASFLRTCRGQWLWHGLCPLPGALGCTPASIIRLACQPEGLAPMEHGELGGPTFLFVWQAVPYQGSHHIIYIVTISLCVSLCI